MNISSLINFLNQLESKGILSEKVNNLIQDRLDFNTNFVGKLFLVFCAIIGALFGAAAIFEFITHNWDDIPKHIRGFMSLIPLFVALYFYYLAIFKRKNSVSWIEATSVFLFLMIGASIALVSSTYQLDGDFSTFMWVWLLLTVPLFYIARASGIAILYLFLSLYFIYPPIQYLFTQDFRALFAKNDYYLLFWMFFFLFLPHFFMTLNFKSRKQSMRSIYLGYVIVFVLVAALTDGVKGGWIWWTLSFLLFSMSIGNRFFGQNLTVLGKPFQSLPLYFLFFTLLAGSTEDGMRELFELENLTYFSEWESTSKWHYILGFILTVIATGIAWITIRKKSIIHRSITYLPIFVFSLMILHYINHWYAFDMTWIGRLAMNLYILGFGIAAMIMGNRQKNAAALFYGLFLVCALLWIRYYDMDIPFWLKGFMFLGVSGLFFFIHFVFSGEVDNRLRSESEEATLSETPIEETASVETTETTNNQNESITSTEEE